MAVVARIDGKAHNAEVCIVLLLNQHVITLFVTNEISTAWTLETIVIALFNSPITEAFEDVYLDGLTVLDAVVGVSWAHDRHDVHFFYAV